MGTYWSVEECAWVERVPEAVPPPVHVPEQPDAPDVEQPAERVLS